MVQSRLRHHPDWRFPVQGTPSFSRPTYPHPAPNSSASYAHWGLKRSCPPRPGAAFSPEEETKIRGCLLHSLGSAHFWLTPPHGEATGDSQDWIGKVEWNQPWPESNKREQPLPAYLDLEEDIILGGRRGAEHAQAPVLAPNQRRLRHHAQRAPFLSSKHAHSHKALTTPDANYHHAVCEAPPPPAKPRPSSSVRTLCTCAKVRPRPRAVFRTDRAVPALSPHSCRWRVLGREQPRAASPRPSGRAGARSPVPSTPLPRRVREGPSRCRVPEGLRGRRRHGSRWSRRISIRWSSTCTTCPRAWPGGSAPSCWVRGAVGSGREPGKRAPGRPAEGGRPGSRLKGRPRGWRNARGEKVCVWGGGPLSPPLQSSRLNPGRGRGGVTPSPSPSEPLQLGGGISRRWVPVGVLTRSWSPLTLLLPRRGDEVPFRAVPRVVKGTLRRTAFAPRQRETSCSLWDRWGEKARACCTGAPPVAPRENKVGVSRLPNSRIHRVRPDFVSTVPKLIAFTHMVRKQLEDWVLLGQ